MLVWNRLKQLCKGDEGKGEVGHVLPISKFPLAYPPAVGTGSPTLEVVAAEAYATCAKGLSRKICVRGTLGLRRKSNGGEVSGR